MAHPMPKELTAKLGLCVAGLLTGVLWTASALAADESTLDSVNGIEFFEKKVRPILVQHCYECHSGTERSGGMQLDSKDGLLAGGDSGAAVVSGDVERSRMIDAVRYQNRELQMPPDNPLSAADIAVLEHWVAVGLPDPRTSANVPAVTGISLQDGRDFWSLKPVVSPQLPMVQNTDWVRSPVDHFILARMESHGLRPAPAADKLSLIRRVTLDLTGLPPTLEEIRVFLADESDSAWRKTIERLLASPQYGVRWGRHWLDVARYADSNGLDENLAHGNAWRYRDYVVNSFNRNKPFDRFLIEQLAGDIVPEASRSTRIATGFLALGAKVLAEPDMEKLVMDTVDEQLDTTGKVFMGMSIGCARCHDHKFDPFSQTDYYALAAIFRSTRTFSATRTGIPKYWFEHSFATDEELDQLKIMDEVVAKKQSAAESFRREAMAKIRSAAREKAADYLAAAVGIQPDAPFSVFKSAAKMRELHPRILHHCRTHLEYHRYDPVFESWHSLAPRGAAVVQEQFRQLFAEAESAWAAVSQISPAVQSLDDPQLEAVRQTLDDASGFLAVPPGVKDAFDEETLEQYERLAEEARVLESQAADEPAAMGVCEQETLTSLPIHIRGSYLNPGKEVAREFPEVMRTSRVRPVFPAGQSGRLELARWMASTQHPLTARVFVNRIWNWHFGRGIVTTTENFGRLGSRPTHPQLLDWLAYQFMETGWNIRDLHRLILLSGTYQMAVTHADEAAGQAVDPENLLLWKFRLQRLDAEQLRDSVLAVSGRLDTTPGGKTIPLRNRQFVFDHTSEDHTTYVSVLRSIYVPVIRNNLYTLFEQFDFPDPTMPTGNRTETVIAPQALLLMNADLVVKSAKQMAARLLDGSENDSQRISLAYITTVGRPSTADENCRALAFIDDLTSTEGSTAGPDEEQRLRAWTMFCQSLIASNDFLYVR